MNLRRWFRPVVLRMRGYVPGEQPLSRRVVKLNTNESPYPPPAPVRAAARKLSAEALRKYPPPTAAALRKRLARVHRWPAAGILVGNGSDEVLNMLFRACVGKGDRVQFPDVTYSLYPVLNAVSEGRVREVRLDGDFDLDFSGFAKDARLTLFAYPNPPVGNVFDRRAILAFCRHARGLVLIDEAYVDFADSDCLSVARACPNVLILRTFSKSYSLAGARLGYVLGNPKVIEQLSKVKDSYNVNRVTQALGLAAFSPAGLAGMRANVRRIRFERVRLAGALRRMGFRVPESRANFLMAMRPRGAKPGAQALYQGLKKRGVLVRYFPHERLKDGLRITVGSPSENNRLLMELKRLLKHRVHEVHRVGNG